MPLSEAQASRLHQFTANLAANSGREKKVILTVKGERFGASMAERGQHLVQELITELQKSLSEDEIASGLEFLRASVSFFQRIYPRARRNLGSLE